MADALPALPEGFTLDGAAHPPLPEGFTLDAPFAAAPADNSGFFGPAARVAGGMAEGLSAAMQKTSPIVRQIGGQLNYQPLGEAVPADQNDLGKPAYAVGGQWQPIDPTQHVVLNDPMTGKPSVFRRSPETDENTALSLGRMLGFGMLAPSDVPASTFGTMGRQAIGNRFAEPQDRALQQIGGAMRADVEAGGPGPQQISDALSAAGAPSTILDVAGENVRGLGGQVARMPGPGRQQMMSTLNERDALSGGRLADVTNNLGADGPSNFVAADALHQNARSASAPLYEKAFAPGSVAPLERQFEGALADAGKTRFEASAELAQAQRQMTVARAQKTMAGDNVYRTSTALENERAAQQAIDDAQQRLEGATTSADEMRARLQQAQAAREAGVRGGVWSPRLQQFLDDPITKSGLREGLEIQRLEALAENRPFNPTDFAVRIENGEPVVAAVPNMRTLDAAKRGLDKMLEGYRDSTTGRLMLDQRGHAIDQVRRSFLGELDNLNPDYAAARAAYAGPQQSRGALQQGAQVFNRDPDQIASEIARLSPSEQQFYRLGAANALKTTLAKTSSGGDEARALIGNAYRQKQLQAVFPNADQLIDAARGESTMFGTRQAMLGGSQTAARLAQDNSEGGGFMRPLSEAATALLTHEPMLAAKSGVSALQSMFKNGKMTPEIGSKIAEFLLSSDPATARAWLMDAFGKSATATTRLRPAVPLVDQAAQQAPMISGR